MKFASNYVCFKIGKFGTIVICPICFKKDGEFRHTGIFTNKICAICGKECNETK